MKDGLRQSMAWVHTWAGLLVCWLLLLVFMAGTAAYYRHEITFWMKPELHAAAASAVRTRAAVLVVVGRCCTSCPLVVGHRRLMETIVILT